MHSGVAFHALLGTALVLAAVPAFAQDDIIIGAATDPRSCNIDNAIHASIDEIMEHSSALDGKCVAVAGFWTARALFSHASDAKKPRSNADTAFRRHRIGIYAREEVLEAAPHQASRYTMVGVLGQCETAWPGAIMVMGYCHYTDGPFLKVSQAIPGQERTAR